MANFRSIVLTLPECCPDEAVLIEQYLDMGAADRIHLRHPGMAADDMRILLGKINPRFYSRITLHDNFCLATEFPGLGIHLNSRNRSIPSDYPGGSVSVSLHAQEQIFALAAGNSIDGVAADRFDYVFLSPIFKSISKSGYDTTVPVTPALSGAIKKLRVIALGGCTPDKFAGLNRAEFSGAAMLGYAWPENGDISVTAQNINVCKRRCAMANFGLQFITDSDTVAGTVGQARLALAGGCRWVQVRIKGAPVADVRAALLQLVDDCRAWRATLIVDDHVELACMQGVDGVHLGQTDMPVADARRILPGDKIIGLTVNNMEHAERALGQDIDYIGMGPWRFTSTKQNLAPVLGADGIRQVIDYLGAHCCECPVVLIGGLTPADAAAVFDAGGAGMAVGGAIAHAADPLRATETFVAEIQKVKPEF